MKARYFETELSYLRERGREFSARYPQVAPFLGERSNDPDVERLLEGVAFLTAAIRERADDAFPELAALFSSLLVPQLTRFVPSATLLEFRPERRGLGPPVPVPRGTEVAGTANDGTRCVFRTTSEIDILPVVIESATHHRTKSDVDELVLSLKIPDHLIGFTSTKAIELFLLGSVPFWASLRSWFLHYCREIRVEAAGVVQGRIDPGTLGYRGFDDGDRLLPGSPLEHDVFSRVADIFVLPEMFAFIKIPPLRQLLRPSMDLVFVFENAPRLPRSPITGDIRLNCVPAINLFDCEADPVRYNPTDPWHFLRAAHYHPRQCEIWDVTSVVGIKPDARREYPSFESFELDPEEQATFYVTRRRRATSWPGTDVMLSLSGATDAPALTDAEVLSSTLRCSNRDRAATIELGALCEHARGSGIKVPFANITPITPPLYPHDDVELAWRLSSHVALAQRGIHHAGTLRSVLAAYNFATGAHPKQSATNARWIDSIADVTVETKVRMLRGAPITGTQATVTLDSSAYASHAEAWMFGEVLADLFARRVPLNSFSQLVVTIAPSGERRTWGPRNGGRAL